MSLIIRTKRGTEARVLEEDMQLGEMAFATDTCTVWGFNGVYKCVVGRALVDNESNMSDYNGSVGRFFYANDTKDLYVHNGGGWDNVTEVTLSGTNGIVTTCSGNTWFIDSGTRTHENELFTWDNLRQEWLSVSRMQAFWGLPSNSVENVYLRLSGTMIPQDVNSGFYVPRNSMITKIHATRTKATASGEFQIRPYGGTAITSFTLNTDVYRGFDFSCSSSVSAGSLLCCYLSGASNATSQPQCWIELASIMP